MLLSQPGLPMSLSSWPRALCSHWKCCSQVTVWLDGQKAGGFEFATATSAMTATAAIANANAARGGVAATPSKNLRSGLRELPEPGPMP